MLCCCSYHKYDAEDVLFFQIACFGGVNLMVLDEDFHHLQYLPLPRGETPPIVAIAWSNSAHQVGRDSHSHRIS